MKGHFKFINKKDKLSAELNAAANELYHQLRDLDVDSLDMDPFCKSYFKECHSGRLIFSLRCSAAIIHDSVKLSGKEIEKISFVDYGAGLGTLFMLAAKLPFKNVIYNDHLQEWCSSARVICNALAIPIQHFAKGDIDELIAYCTSHQLTPDIIASRNVIEHIYDLGYFFKKISSALPGAIIYSTTTANKRNPAMHLRHILLHRNMEKKYFLKQRAELIKKKLPDIPDAKLTKAIKQTRGRAMNDFDKAVEEFNLKGSIDLPAHLHSNTCDATNGVWAEHLLSIQEYEQLIASAGLSMITKPGFWDSNYKNPIMNLMGNTINLFISSKSGCFLSPFICIIAIPNKVAARTG